MPTDDKPKPATTATAPSIADLQRRFNAGAQGKKLADHPDGELAGRGAPPGPRLRDSMPTATAEQTSAALRGLKPTDEINRILGAFVENGGEDRITDAQALANANGVVPQQALPNLRQALPGAARAPQPPALPGRIAAGPHQGGQLPARIAQAARTLPQRITTHLTEAAPNATQWHAIRHLPAYIMSPIRAQGRRVFDRLTSLPIEDIQMLGNLQGQGPNRPEDVRRVAAAIDRNGTRLSIQHLNFGPELQQYGADVAVYQCADMQFLLVRDFAGEYVYGWPAETSRIQTALAGPNAAERLEGGVQALPGPDNPLMRP